MSYRSNQRNEGGGRGGLGRRDGGRAVDWVVDGVGEGSAELVGRRLGVVLEYNTVVKKQTKHLQGDNYFAIQWYFGICCNVRCSKTPYGC